MAQTPLAYRHVATVAMLAEMNFCAARLQLALPLPIRADAILRQFLSPPNGRRFAGRIDTAEYSFSFPRSGRLGYITKLQEGTPYGAGLQPPEGMAIEDHLRQMAKRKSRLDTDGAYQLAVKWLTAIEVDVRSLELQHAPHVQQMKIRERLPLGWFGFQKLLPVFEVRWGVLDPRVHRFPVVTVTLFGDKEEMLELRQADESFSKRPFDLIKDLEQLLGISDEEFLNYSDIQRTELVARFADATAAQHSS